MTATNNGLDPGPGMATSPLAAARGAHMKNLSRARVRPRRRLTAAACAVILALALLMWAWRSGVEGDLVKATWFAGYADVTVSPAYDFEAAKMKDFILAFVVASPSSPCTASWGPDYTLDGAGDALDLDGRLKSLYARGGTAAISFGGAVNQELANACIDESRLEAAYREVIDRYHPAALDFDLEGANLLDEGAGARRAKVIAELQQARGPLEQRLSVWLTLPASPRGLTDSGITAVDQMLAAGVQLSGVNLMTMNYGESRSSSQSMLEASTSAATAAHDQLSIVYQRAGMNLSSENLWKKIGLTPMIGQNDLPGEVFDIRAAEGLRDFAGQKGIRRLSMWSLNRDAACRTGGQSELASHVCSGVSQAPGQFAGLLGGGLTGRIG
jgi:chitinase